MRPDYASHYRDLYERHWWWRTREVLLLDELKRHAPAGGWGSILDVGCGDGLFFDQLGQFGEVWGVEPDARLLTTGGNHRSRIHEGPFDSGYKPERTFRLILMLDVLEHMSNPEDALRRAALLLEPDGRLLLTVPAFRLLWTAHDDFNQHVDRYTIRRIRDLAERGGFAVDSARYLFRWLVPAKLAVRALEVITPGRATPERVPHQWLNRLLLGLSLAEARLLAHVPLPFGSSVLVWCRRNAAAFSGTAPPPHAS